MARRKQRQKQQDKSQNPSSQIKGAEVSKEGTPGQGSSNDGKDVAKESATGCNDPEWYAEDPNLLRDAATIPFSLPHGALLPINYRNLMPLELTGDPAADINDNQGNYRAAGGVCTLYLKHSIGTNDNYNSPANVAANALFAALRKANSGRKNYEPADAFIYCLTMAELYSLVFWMQRLYNYAFMYSERNFYIGREMIIDNGVNPDSILANLANFRYRLNAYINKISSFAVPSSIKYFRRRVFMYSNYYMENPNGNIKDQLYQFAPMWVYKFALDRRQRGSLEATALLYGHVGDNPDGGLLSVDNLFTFLENVLGDIPGDEDFGIISGDVLKAFEGNIIGLAPIPEDGGLLPVYDPWVLSQFKNSNIAPFVSGMGIYYPSDPSNAWGYFGNIYQNDNGMIFSKERLRGQGGNPEAAPYASHVKALANSLVLSVETPDPGVGDVIEGTRLMSLLLTTGAGDKPSTSSTVPNSYTQWNLCAGTEIVVSACYTIRSKDYVDGQPQVGYHRIMETAPCSGATLPNTDLEMHWDSTSTGIASFDSLVKLQFKYAPNWYIISRVANSGGDTVELRATTCVSNIDNMALITIKELQRLHETALLSLFYVPGVAKLV